MKRVSREQCNTEFYSRFWFCVYFPDNFVRSPYYLSWDTDIEMCFKGVLLYFSCNYHTYKRKYYFSLIKATWPCIDIINHDEKHFCCYCYLKNIPLKYPSIIPKSKPLIFHAMNVFITECDSTGPPETRRQLSVPTEQRRTERLPTENQGF